MSVTEADVARIDFAKGGGLVPAIVQHAATGAVLMLGFMNEEALGATLARGRVVFFSRSRQRLWEKGASSGHQLQLVSVRVDCDADTLLVRALPTGPVCHLGTATCFGDAHETVHEPLAFLARLEQVIAERIAQRPESSYTAGLVAAGPKRLAQKVAEEAVEVALATAAGSDAEVVAEAADLVFHLLVLLRSRAIPLARVSAELEQRHAART
ncbi:MAG TPA: bifunctional phosphoribosyl-AMP cyclohydrolase/phosphoribosyl-ATP diphosphatase HisIE [Steroidobacteraceae bacterium]|nr:bifunctional phosphoribosyl-AMP cyclohydrolase/phosphoribosyl-ATP diphosphatase HisIE [Steroidobacteraceae bacterium]